ncbi:MAG: hypothetical protein V7745_02975 [Pseudomonadales bacterium]
MNKLITGAVLAVAVVAGTVWTFSGDTPSRTTETNFTTAALDSHSDHLALIPADTLFYIGSLEPVSAKDMMASMSSMYQLADPSMQPVMDEFFNKAESTGGKFAASLVNFFLAGMSDPQATFEKTGAKDELFSSVYSVGLMPVLRYEADKARFDQFITQLETDAQVSAITKELNGVAYRSYPLTEGAPKALNIIVAHHAGDAIFTLALADTEQQNLSIALGFQQPVESLKDSGTIQRIKNEYGYLPDSLGYLSVKQLVTALTSNDNSAGKTLAALDSGNQDWLQEMRSPICAAEFSGIADVWPRWVTGYRGLEYSEKGFSGEFHMAIEIKNAALNTTLQKIRGHLPADLTSGIPHIFSMALGLDVNSLDEVLGEIAGHAEGLQYQCSLLQSLNGAADSINGVRPMMAMSTGMARGLQGLRLSVFDIQGDLQSGEVSDVDAMISLSGDQVRGILNMVMAMNPGGAIDIPADGSPVALPLPAELMQGAATSIEAYLAVKDDHAVVFTGEAATAVQGKILDEPLNHDGFLFFSMDYGKYMKLASAYMDVAAPTQVANEQMQIDMEQFRKAFENIDYKEEVLMRFTAKGIELSGNIEINNQ